MSPRDDGRGSAAPWPVVLAVAVAVVLVQVSTRAPMLGGWSLWPDSYEYLLIANSWANGTGFVDPVQWFNIPGTGPVAPAFAVRGPLVPFFLGIALWFGATVLTVIQLYAVWSAAVLGILVWGGAG